MWQAWHNFYDLLDYPWLVLSALFALGAILLHLRIRQWPTLLQLIGASAYFLNDAWGAFATFVAAHSEHSMFWEHGLEGLDRWPLYIPQTLLRILTLCFPVGFFWYALRVFRRI